MTNIEEIEKEFDEKFYFLVDNNDKRKEKEIKFFLREKMESTLKEEKEKWETAISYNVEPEIIERIFRAYKSLNK